MKKTYALILTLFVLLLPESSAAYVFNDDFSGDSINQAVWTVGESQNTVALDNANHRIVMTQHGKDGTSNLSFDKYPIVGDFDIRVDYEILTPRPASYFNGNQERIGLSAEGIGGVERLSDGFFGDWYQAGGGEVYLTDFQLMGKGINPWPGINTEDLSGKLRLTRAGSTVSGYYWNGSDWALIHSEEDGYTGPIKGFWFNIHNGHYDQSEMQIAFDNFYLQAPDWAGIPPKPEVADLVVVLQVLAGISPPDVNRPALDYLGKLDLPAALYILREITGLTSGVDNAVATITVSPGTVLLTEQGETRTLSAKAYNAAGMELPVSAFSWSSSRPADVDVAADGVATANTHLGSAVVTATAGGVSSAPVLMMVATPVTEAVLVDDAQVVGDPRPVDQEAVYGIGWRYLVELKGDLMPTVGDVLLGSGEAPVAGRVVSVDTSGPNPVVELEVVPANELFTELKIDTVLDLSNVAPEIAESQNSSYSLISQPGGVYKLAMPTNQVRPFSAVGTRALGPFSCEAQTSGAFPLALSGGATGLTVTPSLNFSLVYDSSQGGLQKIAIGGNVKAEFTVSDTLTLGFTGKVTCEGEILHIRIPIGGAASLLFGAIVPVGAGFELGGELNLAQLGFELKATGEADFEAGMSCPNGLNCSAITTINTKGGLDSRWITPDLSNITAQLQLKPSLSGYGFAELALGPAFWRAAQLRFVRAKAGLAQEADLKRVAAQLADDTYHSDYKLSLASSVGTSPDLSNLCQFLNVSLAPLELKFTTPISSSPAISGAFADVGEFITGDPVEFTVNLAPSTLTYLTVYNVSKVQIYRKVVNLFGEVDAILVGSQSATPGQKDFSISWTADYNGSIDKDFFAFVVTRFLPFPYFGSLELGQVYGSYDIVRGGAQVRTSELFPVGDPRRCIDAEKLPYERFYPLPVHLEAACPNSSVSADVTGTPDAVVIEATASTSGVVGKPIVDIEVVMRPSANGTLRITLNPDWFWGNGSSFTHVLSPTGSSTPGYVSCVDGVNSPVECTPPNAIFEFPVEANQEYNINFRSHTECDWGCPSGGSGILGTATLLP